MTRAHRIDAGASAGVHGGNARHSRSRVTSQIFLPKYGTPLPRAKPEVRGWQITLSILGEIREEEEEEVVSLPGHFEHPLPDHMYHPYICNRGPLSNGTS